MSGTFGYELNLGALTAAEKEEIKEQIREYHKYAGLIQKGDYYRLTNPFESEVGAWAFIAPDKSEALLNAVMLEIHGNMTVTYVKLKGLKNGKLYRDEKTGSVYPADALMEIGLPLPMKLGEYRAYQMHLIME